ncbi:MAG: hypothetical protein WBA63_06895 [Thermomicrobiales bacterium]
MMTKGGLIATLLFLLAPLTGSIPITASTGTPIATPDASPAAAGNGCDQLVPYFRQLAALIEGNDGLAILRTVNNDVLALSETQAATVVASLDELIPHVRAITPPAPATAYHQAFVDYLAWYRDLAAHRDPASHQRLINADKRIVPAIGRAAFTGQAICGADVWNNAQQASFSSATPAP